MHKPVLTILLLTLLIPAAYSDELDAENLQQKLKQRDQVILELIERVEALEKKLGVQQNPADNTARSDSDSGTKKAVTASTTPDADSQGNSPGRVVVNENTAERALERSLTRDGALLLSPGIFEFEPRIAYARQEDATPSFVMSGSGVIASETERNSDTLTAGLLLRLGLPADSQLEIGLPYRWRRNETVTNVNFLPVETSSQSGNGLGDVQVTFAKTFLRADSGQPDLIGRLTWDTDSGDSSDNGVSLGGGFNELRGALSFIKRQDPVVFVGGLSYEYTFENESLQPGETFAANFGSYIALNPQTSLNMALSMAYQKETQVGGTRIDGSDRKIASLVIGGSTLLARGTLLNLTVGIGLTDDSDDFSLLLSLPVRLDNRLF